MKYIRLLRTGVMVPGIALIAVFLFLRLSPYPTLKIFLEREHSIRFYDHKGALLQITAVEDGIRREYAPLEEIPKQLQDIIIYAEDRRFYTHLGVDLFAAVRAAMQNISGGKTVSGASTITMQLARIIDGGQNRTLSGKIAEGFNAVRLSTRFSKKRILEMYINSVPFGGKSEGFVSAARSIFSKDIAHLSPAEMLLLSVIPRRPSLYNPLANPDAGVQAAYTLAGIKPLAKKHIEIASINKDDLKFAAGSAVRFNYPFAMPHYIRYITNRLRAGGSKKIPNTITLSANLRLQELTENLIYANVERYYSSRLTNGAAILIDNSTGEILCWVGSADFYNNENSGQIDGVLALNQPGSSMKPFLYAMALESGFLPTDIFADIPKNYGETELYIPQNFNNRFNGPVLFRTALSSSLNIPAVDLLYRIGIKNYAEKLYALNFDSIKQSIDDAGLGLALGNAPVSLLELVRAFSVFPNDGRLIDLRETPVSSDTKNSAGVNAPQIYESDTARIISSMLSDKSSRVLAFGLETNFNMPFPSMFKTGTANQYQSIVALAATPLYTAGVWMGNFSGETVIGKTGSSIPAYIVREMLMAVQGRQSVPFNKPDGWELKPVCALSGMEPSPYCDALVNEWRRRFAGTQNAGTQSAGRQSADPENTDVTEKCTWHTAGKTTYPAEYQAWFFSTNRQGELDYGSAPLEILSPRDGFLFYNNSGIGLSEIPVEVIGGSGDELTVSYDNETWKVPRPFVFFLPQRPGNHTLLIRCGEEETRVSFRVE
ncbi:penicillin-binding protein 1A [Spirochaetia bacterium]|nr:penicillin-binding protein 1A [Spirochaetia bacterium]